MSSDSKQMMGFTLNLGRKKCAQSDYFACVLFHQGETKVIDTTQLESIRKRVRPIDMQSDFESRKLWNNVTEALQRNDVDGATQHKHFLEERQRQGEKYRRETTTQFPTRVSP